MTTEGDPAEDQTGSSRFEPPVSALLGRLYLDQGHLDDAEAVFRAALAVDAADGAAREGLEAVRRARDRSSGDQGGGTTASPRPSTEERIRRLRLWLDGVRRARLGQRAER